MVRSQFGDVRHSHYIEGVTRKRTAFEDSACQMVDKGVLALSTQDTFEAGGSSQGTPVKLLTLLKTPTAPAKSPLMHAGMLQCQRSVSSGLSN